VGESGAAMLAIAEGMSESPMSSTTTPDTSGVNTRRSRGTNGARSICTGAMVSDMPSMSGSPPARPACTSGCTNAKLVPVTLSRPEPTGPGRVVCKSAPSAEERSDMLTRYAVSAGASARMRARIKGGVIVPTTIAATCCKLTRSAVPRGTRSSRPYTSA
jgi:hypothetical protein